MFLKLKLLFNIALLKVPKICFRDSKPGKSTKINGQCLKNLGLSGFLPMSVGGLHAPTN